MHNGFDQKLASDTIRSYHDCAVP